MTILIRLRMFLPSLVLWPVPKVLSVSGNMKTSSAEEKRKMEHADAAQEDFHEDPELSTV